MDTPSTVLIDSNRLSREGLLAILGRGEIEVVAEAASLEELGQPAEPAPDLVLIDCGVDAQRARGELERLRQFYPDSRIVVLASSDAADFLIECFAAPIDGLISKNVSSQALVKSLHLVLAGERVFPAHLVSLLLANHRPRPATEQTPRLQPGGPSLSEREIEIVQCLVAGDSNKAIANRLGVTEATVKVHLKSILRKIHARNRTQAAIWAINNGLSAAGLNGGYQN